MKLVMRRNQARLSSTEKKQFTDAVLVLKAQRSGNTNPYDMFVRDHVEGMFGGHRGPAFFAWHRFFLNAFEQTLQSVSPQYSLFGLPYWDWSVAQSAQSSWPFTDDFLGGNGNATADYQVVDGPFAYDKGRWRLNVLVDNMDVDRGSNPYLGSYLRREFGSNVSSLPTPADVTAALNQTAYDKGTLWDMRSDSGFRNMAEGWIPGSEPQMHGRVHTWVGGSMLPMTSPNDPVFWLVHCFGDKLWADWQAMHKDQQPYLPTTGANLGHNLNDSMPPFDAAGNIVTPAQMLNHRALGYRYDTEDYLLPGEELYPDQWLPSASLAHSAVGFLLWCRRDMGRVQLNDNRGGSTWVAPSTNPGPAGSRLKLRQDGNLILYDPSKDPNAQNPFWTSETPGHPNARLRVLDTGRVALYPSGGGEPYWSKP